LNGTRANWDDGKLYLIKSPSEYTCPILTVLFISDCEEIYTSGEGQKFTLENWPGGWRPK
jgi:hypothetical protein